MVLKIVLAPCNEELPVLELRLAVSVLSLQHLFKLSNTRVAAKVSGAAPFPETWRFWAWAVEQITDFALALGRILLRGRPALLEAFSFFY